jgi:hypothetical protein
LSVLLPWNESAARSAIVDFVARVTKDGGTEFVPPSALVDSSRATSIEARYL